MRLNTPLSFFLTGGELEAQHSPIQESTGLESQSHFALLQVGQGLTQKGAYARIPGSSYVVQQTRELTPRWIVAWIRVRSNSGEPRSRGVMTFQLFVSKQDVSEDGARRSSFYHGILTRHIVNKVQARFPRHVLVPQRPRHHCGITLRGSYLGARAPCTQST